MIREMAGEAAATVPVRPGGTPGVEPGSGWSKVVDISALTKGDRIEVRRGGLVLFGGLVDEAAPELGIVWLREHTLNERRILDPAGVSIWRNLRADGS
ncbi:hypothetical protein GCM10023081_22280 [Arthrobacter ginkgonis]|uniref:Uncharacterized protein n=1 Tax=Arthrobacter ginkgonis TaxID=1630594 RepID=A0ABP7C979_9MICC